MIWGRGNGIGKFSLGLFGLAFRFTLVSFSGVETAGHCCGRGHAMDFMALNCDGWRQSSSYRVYLELFLEQ
jgi:hypothetical protein